MKTTIEKIIEYFNDNPDQFNACIEELDSYNGYLNDSRYYEMELLRLDRAAINVISAYLISLKGEKQ